MNEVILCLISGGVAAALVKAIETLVTWHLNRKAVKEDRAEEREDRTDKLVDSVKELKDGEKQKSEKIDERLRGIEKRLDALTEAQKVILLDRILYLGQSYVDKGIITYDDRKRFHDMHKSYHDGLGGNGDADLIVQSVDELPLKHGR